MPSPEERATTLKQTLTNSEIHPYKQNLSNPQIKFNCNGQKEVDIIEQIMTNIDFIFIDIRLDNIEKRIKLIEKSLIERNEITAQSLFFSLIISGAFVGGLGAVAGSWGGLQLKKLVDNPTPKQTAIATDFVKDGVKRIIRDHLNKKQPNLEGNTSYFEQMKINIRLSLNEMKREIGSSDYDKLPKGQKSITHSFLCNFKEITLSDDGRKMFKDIIIHEYENYAILYNPFNLIDNNETFSRYEYEREHTMSLNSLHFLVYIKIKKFFDEMGIKSFLDVFGTGPSSKIFGFLSVKHMQKIHIYTEVYNTNVKHAIVLTIRVQIKDKAVLFYRYFLMFISSISDFNLNLQSYKYLDINNSNDLFKNANRKMIDNSILYALNHKTFFDKLIKN